MSEHSRQGFLGSAREPDDPKSALALRPSADRGDGSQTRRRRRQSRANPSLETRNSLLAGKIQGNSSISASDIRISHRMYSWDQRLTVKIPCELEQGNNCARAGN